jgi:leucyl aminopeptidase (aminopeptidase T)
MKVEERIQMFKDIFAPKSGETVLFLTDVPHGDVADSDGWAARRKMVQDWYESFRKMGAEVGFSVRILKYLATGQPNAPIPREMIEAARKSSLVIAMTEYSASSSLKPICDAARAMTRCASMPGVEKRMERTAFRADYAEIQAWAVAIETILNAAVGAEIVFSTHDTLYLDLRYRRAGSDRGDCSKPGQFINLPSGEGFKVPYEAVAEEVTSFGKSKTEGILPRSFHGELAKYVIRNNSIVDIIGSGKEAERMRVFFAQNDTRRNIAELGIGCNPEATISGNIVEDEKVGLHIAYGTSVHIGGKVESDVHEDIIYAKGSPVEGITLTLINEDGARTELISDAVLRRHLLCSVSS